MAARGSRAFGGGRLVVATHNPGKLREIADLLRPFPITVEGAAAHGLAEPEETGASFRENAELKARAAARGARLPALADDSGLVVDALGGAPGIHSARWAGPERDFRLAMARLKAELEQKTGRAEGAVARFVCALSLCWPDGHCETFEGTVEGRLTFPPRGEEGFGYDPVFVPAGFDVTFGEMEPAKKHAISHRADAFRKLIAACFSGQRPGATD